MTPQQIESSAAFGKDCGRIKEAIYFLSIDQSSATRPI